MHATPYPPPHDPHGPSAVAQAADRVGATASFLCALHCAALPFVLALLPAIGLGFLANHAFEHWFIAFATLLALTMLIRGYRHHRERLGLAILLPGLVLLWIGGFVVEPQVSAIGHAVLVAHGGSTVALAHVVNLRLSQAADACCEPASRAIV
jgi:hypothetical protein